MDVEKTSSNLKTRRMKQKTGKNNVKKSKKKRLLYPPISPINSFSKFILNVKLKRKVRATSHNEVAAPKVQSACTGSRSRPRGSFSRAACAALGSRG